FNCQKTDHSKQSINQSPKPRQKTDHSKQSINQSPKPQDPETNKHSAHQLDLFRTKDFVASSAAALVQ
ncbi:hypothetical protein O8B93_17090, partial [Agrobacterium rhizogenes]|uniref:hypothetical protein n=1 Tax=Rhizobium rhizogenes TaxID=359 RepID=UPI0022B5F4B9